MGALLLCASFATSSFFAEKAHAQTVQFTNPLIAKRADPQIYLHTNGTYYFTATAPEYDRIELRSASTIAGLSTASPNVIWTHHTTGVMANHIWAPEMHSIGGKWYIYFAAGSSSNAWDIRVYVLENTSADPMQRTWTEKGQLVTNGTTFALDATTFEHNASRYLVWAEADPSLKINTALFIARMSNPWTIEGPGVRISVPDLDWEKVGYAVNEGPAVLKRNGKVFISYSASATDANYCVGLLTASDTSDLLKPASWSKARNPVLKSGNGVYGPGHNQFTTTPDGSVDLLVFHARDYEKINGDPLDDPNRATRVQPLRWNSDGTPNFGAPVANGPITINLGGGGLANGGADGNGGSGGLASAGSGGRRATDGGVGGVDGGNTNRGGSPASGGGSAASGGNLAAGGTLSMGSTATAGGAVNAGGTRNDSGGASGLGGRDGQGLGGGGGNDSQASGGSRGGDTTSGGKLSATGGAPNADDSTSSNGCTCRLTSGSADANRASVALALGLALTLVRRRARPSV